MGAGEHERRAFRLATRTRVPLPATRGVVRARSTRLTPREREVLDLVAEGASNRPSPKALHRREDGERARQQPARQTRCPQPRCRRRARPSAELTRRLPRRAAALVSSAEASAESGQVRSTRASSRWFDARHTQATAHAEHVLADLPAAGCRRVDQVSTISASSRSPAWCDRRPGRPRKRRGSLRRRRGSVSLPG